MPGLLLMHGDDACALPISATRFRSRLCLSHHSTSPTPHRLFVSPGAAAPATWFINAFLSLRRPPWRFFAAQKKARTEEKKEEEEEDSDDEEESSDEEKKPAPAPAAPAVPATPAAPSADATATPATQKKKKK